MLSWTIAGKTGSWILCAYCYGSSRIPSIYANIRFGFMSGTNNTAKLTSYTKRLNAGYLYMQPMYAYGAE
jgi:hypothetical protein